MFKKPPYFGYGRFFGSKKSPLVAGFSKIVCRQVFQRNRRVVSRDMFPDVSPKLRQHIAILSRQLPKQPHPVQLRKSQLESGEIKQIDLPKESLNRSISACVKLALTPVIAMPLNHVFNGMVFDRIQRVLVEFIA